jgi:hypothetical protein
MSKKNVVELCYISTVFVFPSLSRGVLTVSPFILHVGNDYTHRIYSFKRSTTGIKLESNRFHTTLDLHITSISSFFSLSHLSPDVTT